VVAVVADAIIPVVVGEMEPSVEEPPVTDQFVGLYSSLGDRSLGRGSFAHIIISIRPSPR